MIKNHFLRKILLLIFVCEFAIPALGQDLDISSKLNKASEIPLFFENDSLVYLSTKQDGKKGEFITSYDTYHIYKKGHDKPISDIINMFITKASGVEQPYIVSAQNQDYMKNYFGLADMYISYDYASVDKSKILNNSFKANTMMPALSAGGNVLFFISDRPGGEGGLDIWYSMKDKYGYWGKPQNLELINTPGDEITPHCGTDGRFYYASNWKDGEVRDFDIYQSNYRRGQGVLKPLKGYPLINTSEENEIAPVMSPNGKTLWYAISSIKNPITSYYTLKKKNIYEGEPSIHIESPGAANIYWIKDLTNIHYYEILPDHDIYLEKGNDYKVYAPRYICDDCGETQNAELQITNLGDSLYKQQLAMKLTATTEETYLLKNQNNNRLFIQGYWKPLNRQSYKEFKNLAKSGKFDNTAFVDTSLYDYGKKVEMSEQLWANTVQKISEGLYKSSTYCSKSKFLSIIIRVYTDDIEIEDYKAPYAINTKKQYSGDTIITKDEYGKIIPTGLDVTKSSWKIDGNKFKLKAKKQGGNTLLSEIRAYYTQQLIDSLLERYSPIYANLKAQGKAKVISYGMGYDKKNPEERIEITMQRHRVHQNHYRKDSDIDARDMIQIHATPPYTSEFSSTDLTTTKLQSIDNIKLAATTLYADAKPATQMKSEILKQTIYFSAPEIYSKYREIRVPERREHEKKLYFVIAKFDSYDEAKKSLKTLKSRNAKDCEIIIKSDIFAKKEFIIHSPTFENKEEYKSFKKRFNSVLKQVSGTSYFKLYEK